MYAIFLLSCLLATACVVESTGCYSGVLNWCNNNGTSLMHCKVDYGHIHHLNQDLQEYVSLHINSSFNYLLMSSYFGGFVRNREGMEKTLRRLSDSTWEDAIDLIKHMNKRGLHVDFTTHHTAGKVQESFSVNEFEALGYALDYQKAIAQKAITIHQKASTSGKNDPEVASFLENNFLHKHAEVIRNLAGLTSDLKSLTSADLSSLSIYLFDEYLQKI